MHLQISGCVHGICPYNAAIIMYDSKGNFWAATTIESKDDSMLISYFSNSIEWKDKLPKTIEAWVSDKREHNKDVKVIFK